MLSLPWDFMNIQNNMKETFYCRRRDGEGAMLILPSLCQRMMRGASEFLSGVVVVGV